ncbi:MAG: hypothetical protein HY647_07045 [Acidobacteria bacterium]|nr:hypothetical protein [Acidobacteriota bacterium]
MAWVRMVHEDEATGVVKQVYQRHMTQFRRGEAVGEIVKVFSLRPDLLEARVALGNTMTFGGSGLGRYREELIAVSISALLSCKF